MLRKSTLYYNDDLIMSSKRDVFSFVIKHQAYLNVEPYILYVIPSDISMSFPIIYADNLDELKIWCNLYDIKYILEV